MTFVLALLARDGIAVAADGLSHRPLEPSQGGTFWLAKPTDKVVAVGRRALLGFAGDLPLVQPILRRVTASAGQGSHSPRDLAAMFAAASPDLYAEARDRYARLYGPETAEEHAPSARFLVAGLDDEGSPELLETDASGHVADQTAAGYGIVGTDCPYRPFAAGIVERYYPPDATLGVAISFARGLLEDFTRQGFFRILPPVRTWSLSRDHAAAETPSPAVDASPSLRTALEASVRRLASGLPVPTTTTPEVPA